MKTEIAYCGVNCSACSDYINKICPSCNAGTLLAMLIGLPVRRVERLRKIIGLLNQIQRSIGALQLTFTTQAKMFETQ